MYDKVHILQILKDRKPDLQKRYPISELGLFGSYATHNFMIIGEAAARIPDKYKYQHAEIN